MNGEVVSAVLQKTQLAIKMYVYAAHQMEKDVMEEMKQFRTIFIKESLQRLAAEKRQEGTGLNDYFREYIPHPQHGAGIGNFFAQFFRTLRPLASPLLRSVGKHALNTAVGVLGDIAHGDNWKEAVKYRAGQTGERILDQVQGKVGQMMEGSGRPSGMNLSSRITYNDGGHDSHELKRIKAARILLSLHPPTERAGGVKRKSSDSGSSAKRRKPSAKKSKKKKPSGKVAAAKNRRTGKNKKGKKTPKRKTAAKKKKTPAKARGGRKKQPTPQPIVTQAGDGYNWL